MSDRPGVMLWFENRPALALLSDEARGKLFMAIFDYAEFGVVPDFSDNIPLLMAWEFIRPKIDLDGERYANVCAKNKYNTFRRDYAKENTGDIPTFEEWQDTYRGMSYKDFKSLQHEDSSPRLNEDCKTKNSECKSEDYTKQTDADFEALRSRALANFEKRKTEDIGL